LDKYMSSATGDAVERAKLMKMLWDATGTEFAGRHELYERNNYGSHEVIRMHSLFEGQADGTVAQLKTFVEACMADYDLEGWTAPDLMSDDDSPGAAKNSGHPGQVFTSPAAPEAMPAAEDQQVLADRPAKPTPAGTPADTCIQHLFEEQVQRFPDHLAAVCGE